MKKPTAKEKKNSKPQRKTKLRKVEVLSSLPTKADTPELPDLDKSEQPLLYYGPPPAIKALYKKSGFDKDFHPDDLLKHMGEGSTRSEICAAWGITYQMFNDWIDTYPELSNAFAVGKPMFDAYYKRALKFMAFGMMPKARDYSFHFLIKNVAGFNDGGGDHDFSDGSNATLEFVDE